MKRSCYDSERGLSKIINMKAEALVSLGRELSQLKPTWEKESVL